MDVIEINHLNFTYPGSTVKILNDINLKIKKGDFLAVLGDNGSGKSTLCKSINGLIPHFISGEFEGEILINGKNTLTLDVGSLAKEVAYVYQDFENQIVRPVVLDDASYACMNYGYENYEELGIKALKDCGLEERKGDYIWQLSGGQTHLLALAGAIALGPDILILDEPIAQLDPKNSNKVYQVLKELNEKYNKTIITIEHHTEYIANYCSDAILLKDAQIKWHLPVKEALGRVEDLMESKIFPPQVTQAAYILKKENIISKDIELPITVDEGKDVFRDLNYNQKNKESISSNQNENIVTFQNVNVSYNQVTSKPNVIFDKLDLNIKRGEKVALIGSNGAGKTTLMKILLGLVPVNDGKIFLKNKSIKDIKAEELSQSVSLVYQNPEEMFIMDSIEEDIAYAMKVRNVENYQIKSKDLMKRLNLLNISDRDGRLLSGGQMRRASVAIGIALKPEILLLDEPTANLDMATRKEILSLLENIKNTTETVLIATHDMQLVSQWADRIIVLHNGRIIGDGDRDDIFGNPDITNTVKIKPPEIYEMGKILNSNSHTYTVSEFVESFGGINGNN